MTRALLLLSALAVAAVVTAPPVAAQPSAGAPPPEAATPLAARVRAAAEALLADHFPEAARQLEPRVLRVAADVPDGAALRLALPSGQGLPSGHTRVDVRTDAGRAGWALLYVARFDSVAVVRRAVSRGDTLSPDVVGAAWLETTRFHGDPVRPADLRGAAVPTARRSLDAGEALRQSALAWPVAVDTGDPVRVRYRRGGLLLVVDGAAREAGAVGDAIRVYCRSTEATYRARVTAPGAADWLETL